jgi:hypothetical protein
MAILLDDTDVDSIVPVIDERNLALDFNVAMDILIR